MDIHPPWTRVCTLMYHEPHLQPLPARRHALQLGLGRAQARPPPNLSTQRGQHGGHNRQRAAQACSGGMKAWGKTGGLGEGGGGARGFHCGTVATDRGVLMRVCEMWDVSCLRGAPCSEEQKPGQRPERPREQQLASGGGPSPAAAPDLVQQQRRHPAGPCTACAATGPAAAAAAPTVGTCGPCCRCRWCCCHAGGCCRSTVPPPPPPPHTWPLLPCAPAGPCCSPWHLEFLSVLPAWPPTPGMLHLPILGVCGSSGSGSRRFASPLLHHQPIGLLPVAHQVAQRAPAARHPARARGPCGRAGVMGHVHVPPVTHGDGGRRGDGGGWSDTQDMGRAGPVQRIRLAQSTGLIQSDAALLHSCPHRQPPWQPATHPLRPARPPGLPQQQHQHLHAVHRHRQVHQQHGATRTATHSSIGLQGGVCSGAWAGQGMRAWLELRHAHLTTSSSSTPRPPLPPLPPPCAPNPAHTHSPAHTCTYLHSPAPTCSAPPSLAARDPASDAAPE